MTGHVTWCTAVLLLLAVTLSHAVHEEAPICVSTSNCKGNDWVIQERADGEDLIRLIFAVKQKDITPLHDIVNQLASGKKTNVLTLKEVRELTADYEAEAQVFNWLNSNGFSDVEHNIGGFFEAANKISIVEDLLQTQFWIFHSPLSKQLITRALSYSLPEDISEFLDFIGAAQFPLTRLPEPCILLTQSPSINVTTPPLIRRIYSIEDLKVASDKSTQSLFEALTQSFSQDDLSSFLSEYSLPPFEIKDIIGPNDPSMCKIDPNYCVEANLDVQYMLSICQAPTTYWSIPMSVTGDIFLSWILDVGAKENPPLVHSISYGGPEKEFNKMLVKRVDNEIAKLAARGVTVVVASGDDGVAGFAARNNPAMCGFTASYPAQLPHVVSVGATMGPEYGNEEIACTSDQGGLITSGGGFSNYFKVPDWQEKTTKNYLRTAPQLPPLSDFDPTGRGYPDVSLMGHNYVVNIGGNWYQVSGSSASSPVFAALVTLVNGERIKQGKQPLGWLTPKLYSIFQQHPDAFKDVSKGRNNCCAGSKEAAVCCKHGFTATKGWDPVTGFGSVDFSKLKQYLVEL